MRFLVAIFLALVLAACGSSAKLDRLAPGAVVLAFGDSLTFGTGASPTDSYPAVLERSIGTIKVVNAGVPGETSAEGLARLPGVLDEVHPKLLLLCQGGNDFLRHLDEGAARANIRSMLELARARGIGVVLIATPRPGLPPSVPAFYGEIASELKIPLEDASIRSVVLDNRLKSDFVHPNAQGYAQIAEAVRKVLRKAGAI
jgi:lysophospholipase L1-like esterase